MLSRLAEAEARLQVLEDRSGSLPRSLPEPSPAGLEERTRGLSSPPDLHTASAYKMLHCWPRIRLNLTVPNLISQTYLAEYDQADTGLVEANAALDLPSLMLWQVGRALEEFYDSINLWPIYFTDLVHSYSGLSRHHVISSLTEHCAPEGVSQHVAIVELNKLSVSQLLVLSIALRTIDGTSIHLNSSTLLNTAAVSCATALKKQWTLHSGSNEELIPLILTMAYTLLQFWARPFHALGILQSIDPAIKHFSLRHPDDSYVFPSDEAL